MLRESRPGPELDGSFPFLRLGTAQARGCTYRIGETSRERRKRKKKEEKSPNNYVYSPGRVFAHSFFFSEEGCRHPLEFHLSLSLSLSLGEKRKNSAARAPQTTLRHARAPGRKRAFSRGGGALRFLSGDIHGPWALLPAGADEKCTYLCRSVCQHPRIPTGLGRWLVGAERDASDGWPLSAGCLALASHLSGRKASPPPT